MYRDYVQLLGCDVTQTMLPRSLSFTPVSGIMIVVYLFVVSGGCM